MSLYPEYHFTNLHFDNTELLFCGAQQCPPNHLYGPSVRTHFLMVFVHSGKGVFRARNILYHLEAGSTLTAAMLRQGLVDEILCYVAPKFLGAGRPAFALPALDSLAQCQEWETVEVGSVGNDIRMILRKRK